MYNNSYLGTYTIYIQHQSRVMIPSCPSIPISTIYQQRQYANEKNSVIQPSPSPPQWTIHPMISHIHRPAPCQSTVEADISKHRSLTLQRPTNRRLRAPRKRIHTRQDPTPCQRRILRPLDHLRNGDKKSLGVLEWSKDDRFPTATLKWRAHVIVRRRC